MKEKSKELHLTYPLVLDSEENEALLRTLDLSKRVVNYYFKKSYGPETFNYLASSRRPGYKVLEPMVKPRRNYLPSRVQRGMLEIVGRTYRTLNHRKELFEELCKLESEPSRWDLELLKRHGKRYRKAQEILNLGEQVLNYHEKHQELPGTYFALQGWPELKCGMLNYAPDDGQAIRYKVEGTKLHLQLKVADKDKPRERKDWRWIEHTMPLPKIVQGKVLASPTLRAANIRGEMKPVLDVVVRMPIPEKIESDRFLTVDWGVRKITICLFNRDGEQISQPIFLQWGRLQDKLYRIRQQIDVLKSKRGQHPKRSTQARWYNREIAKHWRKFRALQKELSHLVSNVIVEVATLYGCSHIYIEWLKGLKSRHFGRRLNWQINKTVRGQIEEKLEYKCLLNGLTLIRLNPAYTSQFCPKCGCKGHHVKAPDRLNEICKGGAWFVCPSCTFNGDRDYVACHNLARKVVGDNALKHNSTFFAYTTKMSSDWLFRQKTSACRRLSQVLGGWKHSFFLRPFAVGNGIPDT